MEDFLGVWGLGFEVSGSECGEEAMHYASERFWAERCGTTSLNPKP